MTNKSPVTMFIAATTLLAASTFHADLGHGGEKGRGIGGLKEWTTDQDVDAKSKLDKDAKAAAKKAKEEDICIPIGEGENCW